VGLEGSKRKDRAFSCKKYEEKKQHSSPFVKKQSFLCTLFEFYHKFL